MPVYDWRTIEQQNDEVAPYLLFTITDANGCEYSNNIFIDEPGELLYTIDSVIDPTCSPDWSYSNGSICITITGGTNPFPIGAGWTSLGGGVWCLENISAGSYTIDVDDANNCSTNTDSTEVILTRPPVIEAQITSTVTEDCDNNTMIQTNYVFVTGGSPPYEISWSGGDVCDPINPQCMETTESGTYTAFIRDQESLANGCPPIEVEVVIDLPEIGDAAFSYSSPNSIFCNQLANNELITFNNESTGDIEEAPSKIEKTFTPLQVFIKGLGDLFGGLWNWIANSAVGKFLGLK